MNIAQTLENTSSYVDKTKDSFIGTFEILPNQLIHLNNYNVIISKTEFKIVSHHEDPKIFTYDVDANLLRYHRSELLPSIQIKLLSLSEYNVEPNDPVSTLLKGPLYMTTPTNIYITRHDLTDLYSVKNMNMATLFLMRKLY
jgi:hypothetical protein